MNKLEPCFDYCKSGHLSFVESHVRRKLGQFKRYAVENYTGKLKIGATNDPSQRFYDHRRGRRWYEMIILWETSSYRGIQRAERKFIEYAWVYEDVRCINEIAGGGGLNDSGRYYLYVLLG